MKVGILEDDPSQADLIASTLRQAHHNCVTFARSKDLIARLRQETFDLLLLDWNTPDVSAVEVLSWMRRALTTPPPTLIITSRSSQHDIIAGLDAGADDFIIKPVDPPVLLARVNAVLRRAYPYGARGRVENFFGFSFEPLDRRVTMGGDKVVLTAKEFELALAFFRNIHRALSRSYLLEMVWGRNPDVPTRTLDAHVSRVRQKLGLSERGFRLTPVYSYGYRLEKLSSEEPLAEEAERATSAGR